jgi:hypothetical protein
VPKLHVQLSLHSSQDGTDRRTASPPRGTESAQTTTVKKSKEAELDRMGAQYLEQDVRPLEAALLGEQRQLSG